uniref:Lytic transglycosylase, catalytic n=1 Tax=Dechloromonas aromatica (strain RCB) TaxID=159087 RepID=Q47A69_DECAR
MIASTVLPSALQRISTVALDFFQKFLMIAGLVFIVGLIGVQTGRLDLVGNLKSLLPSAEASVAEEATAEELEPEPASLNARMRGAMNYVSHRYRVSDEALRPIFATAQAVGRELHLDPLLIIAVIGVESGFNPFSQSVVGAQGLMQVVPRFHHDKLPEDADSFLDPVTNVLVGARVLKESISRNGGLEDGLQQFGGAANDANRRYATKVLAEKQRLEQAVQRLRAA